MNARACPALIAASFAMSSMAHSQASDAEPVAKLSRSGICHERGTVAYTQTIYFQPFDSMEACLAAGGRLKGERARPGVPSVDYRGSHPPIRIN